MKTQHIDRIFVALADQGRHGMVEQPSQGPATVKNAAFDRLVQAISHTPEEERTP